MTPEDASAWAMQYIDLDNDHYDELVWEAIVTIGAADLYGGDRPYLYGIGDFKEWPLEFTLKCQPT